MVVWVGLVLNHEKTQETGVTALDPEVDNAFHHRVFEGPRTDPGKQQQKSQPNGSMYTSCIQYLVIFALK